PRVSKRGSRFGRCIRSPASSCGAAARGRCWTRSPELDSYSRTPADPTALCVLAASSLRGYSGNVAFVPLLVPRLRGVDRMKWKRWLPVSLLAVSAACWHQVVNTGSTAGTTVVDKPWVTTWLWGLIAAEPIDIRQQCPRGAAVIETETSFVNGLASLVTLGIW